MKNAIKLSAALSVIMTLVIMAALIGCAPKTKVRVRELENKGGATPEWLKTYTAYGVSKLQAQSEFKGKYCIIGEATGVNLQAVLDQAEYSSAMRFGAMLRFNITDEYLARGQGAEQSQSEPNSSTAAGISSGTYNQQIDNVMNVVVNVSYSGGVQREDDWWSLRRRYDPDREDVFRDEYSAYVLYTIPKAELNRQMARALETAVSKDSELYDITIEMARQILEDVR